MSYKSYLDLGMAIKKASGDKPLEKEFSVIKKSFKNSDLFIAKFIASSLSEKPEYFVSDMEEDWKDKFVEHFRIAKTTEAEFCFTDKETGCFVEVKFFTSICLILWTNEVGGRSMSCIDLTGERK